ncbi:MAG: EpsG family protein [Ignavibacteria bacterium]|nr:EpsG family protein [Ignavibacteria bacterium]
MLIKNKIYFIAVFAALVLAFYQTLRIDAPNYDLKQTRHVSIVNNSIEYPYKYRLLNPYITQIWITALSTALPEKPSFIAAYFLQNIIVFSFMLLMLLKFFRLWFDDTGAVICMLLFAAIVPLTLTGYDVLGDMTTAGIMALGFYFINSDKEKYLFPLMFIAAFNELQLILLIPFYFFGKSSNFRNKKVWINSIFLTMIFVAAYGLIYLIRGGSAGSSEVNWYFTKDAAFNLANKSWIPLWIILIAPLLYFVFKDFRSKPEFLKRSAMIVLPLFYFAAFFFIARLREIDKALTIFTILIPLAMCTVFSKLIKTEV